MVFVGYAKRIGYLFYHPTENKIFTKRRGTFLEDELLARGIGENHVDLEEIRESQVTEPVVQTEPEVTDLVVEVEPERTQETTETPSVRRSIRDRRAPERYDDIFMIDEIGRASCRERVFRAV